MKLKIFDYLSFLVALFLIAFISYSVYSGKEQAQYVAIEASGKSYIYSLDTDRNVSVDGPLGTTVIKIKDSKVSVTESPCRDKLCIKAPPLDSVGEWNACMPNKVFIRISGAGEDENEPDSVSY